MRIDYNKIDSRKIRIFVIGEGWDLPSSSYTKNHYTDERWSKKKFVNDPNTLYGSWADQIANHLDAKIYYIQDSNLSFGGAIKETMNVVKTNCQDPDYINYFFVNLPMYKGKLDLFSTTPQENKELEDLSKIIFKGHYSKIGDALETVNDRKKNDHQYMIEIIDEFSKFVKDVSDYHNRFLIQSVHYHAFSNWFGKLVFKDVKEKGKDSPWYHSVTNKEELEKAIERVKQYEENRKYGGYNIATGERIKLEPNKVSKNNANITWFDPKGKETLFSNTFFKGKLNDMEYVQILDFSVAQMVHLLHQYEDNVDVDKVMKLNFFKEDESESSWTRGHFHNRRKVHPISAKDHQRLGEKVFFNLTEDTKLFTI
jgi:hypothetical protein